MPFRRKSWRSSLPGPSPRDRPIRVDPDGRSASTSAPAFVARPEDSPVYYGFPVIESSEVDGFRFGMITDFVAEPGAWGDAFVVAPDDSRAGLVWEEVDDPYFSEVLPPTADRWGVWGVGTELRMRTERDAAALLASLLPELRSRWEQWKAQDRHR